MKKTTQTLHFFLQLFIWVCLFYLPTSFASSIYFSSPNINIHKNYYRISFSTNQPFKYHALALTHPDRIVFDIENGRLNMAVNESWLKSTPIKGIRVGKFNAHTLRIVFDLKQPMKAKSYIQKDSENKYNFIIDLYKLSSKESARLTQLHSIRDIRSKIIRSAESLFKTQAKRSKAQIPVAPKPTITTSQTSFKPHDVVIVIDPGHGGKDPGATGPRGIHEKNVVLKISKDLSRLINRQPGFKAVLTRTGDYYIGLRQRLAIARKYKPDMFVAIHADAYKNRQAYGASVFALSEHGATSEAGRWLAQRENASELMGGVNLANKDHLLQSVLISLSQNATIRMSLLMGQDIINALRPVTPLHHGKVEQAAFIVLKSPDIPSFLIETGFISNPTEERNLNNPQYERHMAAAITKGIKNYFTQYPPRHTWLYIKKHSKTYIVQKGDNLSKIAAHFGTTVQNIMAINRLKSTQLRIDQQLILLGVK